MANTPNFVGTANVKGVSFVNADGTAAKTIFTAGANGSRIDQIVATSDNSAALALVISLVQQLTSYRIARIVVPAATVSVPVVTVGVLDSSMFPWLNMTSGGIVIPTGTTIQLNVESAVAATKTLDIVVFGGDF